jgi:hypothetical protein
MRPGRWRGTSGGATAGVVSGVPDPGEAKESGVGRRLGRDRAPRDPRRGNSSVVERQPSKLGVAGSNPVSRSIAQVRASQAASRPAGSAWTGNTIEAHVAQSVEHVLGKDGVTGSSPVMGSSPLPGAE